MLSTLTVYAQTAEESYRQTLKDYLEESRTYYKHQKEHQLKRIDDFYNSQLQSAQSEETETNNALELNLIRFVREHPTSNYLPYALYQLGSIYFERGDKDVEAFAAAEKYFNELFTQYPKFLYSEETLYLLAYSRLSQNKEKEAIQSFTTLLKIYPKSRFIDESNLRIGEFYFHKGEYANALTYYQRILLKPEAPFYNKALYKIAWANYLSQKFEIALRNFITILNLGKNNEFYSEAKQYVAFSLYQLKLGEQAVSQLKPVWSDETYQACLQYGDLLMENGQYRSAAALYQALVDYYPSHPDTPKTSYLTAHALHLQGENQRALQIELIHLQKFNAKDDTRKAVLFDIGSYYYQGWTQKRLGTDYLMQAKKYFDQIIQDYPESHEAYDANFYGAEAAFALGEFSQAVSGYQNVLLSSSYNQHFEDSLFSIIAAHEKRLAGTKNKEEKKQISIQLLVALDDLLKRGKQNFDKQQFTLKSAQVLFSLDRQDDGLIRLQELILTYPDHPAAALAVKESLTSLAKKHRWQEIIDWSNNLSQAPILKNHHDLQQDLDSAYVTARLELAQRLEKRGELLLATHHYREAINHLPDPKESKPLMMHVVEMLRNANLTSTAIAFIKTQSPLDSDQQLALAKLYYQQSRWTETIQTLQPQMLQASMNSSLLPAKLLMANALKNNGQLDDAAKTYFEIGKQSNFAPKIRRESLLLAAELHHQLKQEDAAIADYETLLQFNDDTEIQLRLIQTKIKLGQTSEATKSWLLVSKQRNINHGDTAALYNLISADLAAIQFNHETLYVGKNLNPKKISALERSANYYLKSITSKDPLVYSESMYKLAMLYEKLSQDLAEKGEQTLAEQLHSKASQIHTKHLAEVYKKESYNSWVKLTYNSLANSDVAKKATKSSEELDFQSFSAYEPHGVRYLLEPQPKIQGEITYNGTKQPASALLQRAYMMLATNKSDSELAKLLEALSFANGVNQELLYNLGLTYFNQGNAAAAKATLERIPKNTQRPEIFLLKAYTAISLQNWETAERELRRYLAIFPDSIAIQCDYIALLQATRRHSEALPLIQQLLNENIRTPRLYFLLNQNQVSNPTASEYLLRESLEHYPNDPLLTTTLGQTLDSLTRADEAFATLKEVALSGNHSAALNGLVIIHARMGNFKAAEALLQQAKISEKPQPELLYNLALVQYATGAISDSKTTYQQYLLQGGKARQLGGWLSL